MPAVVGGYGMTHPSDRLPLIGRDAVLGALAARLPRRRMVTIVGAGGAGKTALALAVARRLSPDCFARVCFVDLGAIYDPLTVSATIAQALRSPPDSSSARQRTLLVLDSCEHVSQSVTIVVEQVLAL